MIEELAARWKVLRWMKYASMINQSISDFFCCWPKCCNFHWIANYRMVARTEVNVGTSRRMMLRRHCQAVHSVS